MKRQQPTGTCSKCGYVWMCPLSLLYNDENGNPYHPNCRGGRLILPDVFTEWIQEVTHEHRRNT